MTLRVLFVFALPSGGVDTLNRMRVKALAERGIEGHLLYFQSGSGARNNAGLTVHYTSDPVQIGELLRREAYDAIVVTSFFMQLGMFRGLGYTGPIVLEIQGFGPFEAARHTLLSAAPYINGRANAFLFPHTPHILRILQEGYPSIPRFAFNNPFDAEAFTYVPLKRLDRPVLAWVGRLEANKNWRDFVKIAAQVADAVPDLEIWMLSDPWLAEPGDREQFDAAIGTLGIGGRLKQLHQVPHRQMADIYSMIGDSGGALCMTSQSEGASYTALEALSCRCPVVTTDSDGVRTSLVDGKTALYFDHGDIAGAAALIVRVMRDDKLRNRLADKGQKRVREQFTLRQYADHFAAMLRSLGVNGC